jgi:hypothetical protein
MSISEVNAVKKYLITEEDIHHGLEEGKLKTCSHRSCHGNSYLLLSEDEVRRFVATCLKDPELVDKAAKKKIAARKKKLRDVTRELAVIDARKLALTKRKMDLVAYLKEHAPHNESAASKKRKQLD